MPLAAAGFFEESIAESESSLLLSRITAFARLPFLAGCFFGKSPPVLSSCEDVLDEAAFFVAAGFFAVAAVVLLALAGCFFVGFPDSASSDASFACEATRQRTQD